MTITLIMTILIFMFGISYKILNKELKDWLTPIQELEKNINSTNKYRMVIRRL